MAASGDQTNNNKWPLAKFYFSVSFTGEGAPSGGDIAFQEVSGLDQETEVIEYRHGDSPTFSKIKRPGMIKYTDITCKKGMFKGDSRLITFFQKLTDRTQYYADGAADAARLQITIKLLDEKGNALVTWTLKNAFPKKVSGTDFKSDASEVAVESVEFAHEGITVTAAGTS